MPLSKDDDKYGDLYIDYVVVFQGKKKRRMSCNRVGI